MGKLGNLRDSIDERKSGSATRMFALIVSGKSRRSLQKALIASTTAIRMS